MAARVIQTMTDTRQDIPLVTLAVLAWCWLTAIGTAIACLWLLVLSAPGFGSSSPTAAALAGTGLMLAVVVGIPVVVLWVGLIQQARGRDTWRGPAVTALLLLAVEALAVPTLNLLAGGPVKPLVGGLAVVGLTQIGSAVLILVKPGREPFPTER